jgi:hypothetical protein
MNWQQIVQKRGAERRREERAKNMRVTGYAKLRVLGIAPYTIDKAFGFYLVEFDRTGRSLPLEKCEEVPVVAFDLCYPEGKKVRYSTLREARAAAALMAAERRKEVK